MPIVYAAVAGQSIVKLYAAAMLPGFFLAGLYLAYILGWAIINPKIAPKLASGQYRVTVPDYLHRLEGPRGRSVVPGLVVPSGLRSPCRWLSRGRRRPAGPLGAATVGTLAGAWWYVVIYNAQAARATATVACCAPRAGSSQGYAVSP